MLLRRESCGFEAPRPATFSGVHIRTDDVPTPPPMNNVWLAKVNVWTVVVGSPFGEEPLPLGSRPQPGLHDDNIPPSHRGRVDFHSSLMEPGRLFPWAPPHLSVAPYRQTGAIISPLNYG